MIFGRGDKLLFIGDSIMDYERKKPVGEGLFGAWGHSFVADVGALLGSVYPEERLRVVNMGISGNQARDLAARWDTDVLAQKPDWVIVLIGINDVWRQFDSPLQPETHVSPEAYRAAYEELIRRTQPAVKGMVLMTPYYMDVTHTDPMRLRMDEYGAVVKELAAAHGLPCVDLQSAWDRLFEHMHPDNIAWDRIHPNQTGCMFIAWQFLKAVGFDR